MNEQTTPKVPTVEQVVHFGAMTPGPVDESRLATPGKYFATLAVGLAVGWILGSYGKGK